MSAEGWLDVADKVASMIGAVAGMLSLAFAVVQIRRAVRPGGGVQLVGTPTRGWSSVSMVLGALAFSLGGVWLAASWSHLSVWPVSVLVLMLGLAAAGVFMVEGRGRVVLDAHLRALLIAQWEDAGRHRYQFFDGHAPSLPKIYVEQRAEQPDAGTDGLLTIRQMLAAYRDVLVVSGPGMGKSTLVAQVQYEQARWWLGARRRGAARRAPYGAIVPVAVPAGLLVDRSLPDALAEACRRIGAPEGMRNLFSSTPVRGAVWLVMVDGIDEVLSAHERSRVLASLAGWLERRDPTLRLLITTRPLPFGELAEVRAQRAGEFVLRRFDQADLRSFAENWFTARHGERGSADQAEQFLSRISAARLRVVVEVPLLATIAALVYEAARDRPLPTSRAGLYGRFVEHLLYGRRTIVEQRRRIQAEFERSGEQGEQAWQWLERAFSELLEHLADTHLVADPAPVMARARTWVLSHAPDYTIVAVPGWEGHVRALLTGTALLIERAGDLDFTHYSIAEYLAAGPRARQFEELTWFADVRSPDRRNLALFVLARSLEPADRLVRILLDGLGADVVVAGEILADGVDVAGPLRRRVVTALLDQLRAEEPTAPEALRALVDLCADPAIEASVEAIVDDGKASSWVRLAVANALDVAGGGRMGRLRRLVAEPAFRDDAREWGAQRLRWSGEDLAGIDLPEARQHEDSGDAARSDSSLALHAYRQALVDGPVEPSFRLTVALALADAGDAAGGTALRACLTDPDLRIDLRIQAARALLQLNEHQPVHRLAEQDDQPESMRLPAAVALTEAGDEVGGRVLAELVARDPDLERSVPPVRVAIDAAAAASRTVARAPVRHISATAQDHVPPIWNCPQRNALFVGRDNELHRLFDRLTAPSSSRSIVAVVGLGGIGKSQLAIEYAHRFAEHYDIVWWISAEQPDLIRSSLALLRSKLGLPDAAVEDGLSSTLDALRRGEPFSRWLLIFDNANAPEEIHAYLPQGRGHVVVTSRNPRWSEVSTIELDTFVEPESVALLRSYAPALTHDEAERVADRLDHLPLAIQMAAAWLANTGSVADEYLRRLDTAMAKLKPSSRPDYLLAPSATWLMSLEDLRDTNPGAAKLMELCAFFGPETIPVGWLTSDIALGIIHPDSSREDDPPSIEQLIRELSRYALLFVDSTVSTIQLHRLVQALIRDQLPADQQQENRKHVQAIMADANPDAPDDPTNWSRYAALLLHLHATHLLDSPDAKVRRLVDNLVHYLRVLGDYGACATLAEEAITRWRQTSPEDEPSTLLMRVRLANALRDTGSYTTAYEIDRAAQSDLTRLLGPEHPYTLMSMDGEAHSLRAFGRYREARELCQRVYATSAAVLGDAARRTLNAANNLAVSLRLEGEFEQAASVDQLVWETRRRTLGSSHPLTLGSAAAVGRDRCERGHYSEARLILEETLASCRDTLGENHPETLYTATALAVVHRRSGLPHDALELSVATLERLTKTHSLDHPRVLACAVAVACDQSASGDHESARQTAEDTHLRYGRTHGDDHPFRWACTNNLAVFAYRADDHEKAGALAQAAFDRLHDILGPNHPHTLISAINFANVMSKQGDVVRAIALGDDTHQRLRQTLGANHPDTLAAANNLAINRATAGDPTGHEALAAVHPLSRNQPGPEDPVTRALHDRVAIGREIDPPPT